MKNLITTVHSTVAGDGKILINVIGDGEDLRLVADREPSYPPLRFDREASFRLLGALYQHLGLEPSRLSAADEEKVLAAWRETHIAT